MNWSGRLRHAAEFLLGLEFWLVAALAFIGIFEATWLPVALVVAGLYWPLRRWISGRWSRRTPVDLPIAALVCLALMTLWVTAIPEKTVPQVMRLLLGAALFYAILNWAGGDYRTALEARSHNVMRLRALTWLVAGLGLALAVAALFIVNWPAEKLSFIPSRLYEHFPKPAEINLIGDTANPNVVAGSLSLLLPIGLTACLFAWKACSRLERLLFLTATASMAVVIFLTQSRGAWIALAIGMAIIVVMTWRWGWLIGAGLAMLAVLLAALVGVNNAASALATSTTLGSLEGRMEVWSRAIYMIQDFPFTGIGMGSFTEVADRLYPLFLFAPGSVEHAHNLYLQIAVDLGLFGLAAWLAIWIGLTFKAVKVFRAGQRSGEGWQAGLGAGLLCSQVVLAVHGLTDAVLWGLPRPAILVWLVWGMIAAAFILLDGRKNTQQIPIEAGRLG